jgi:archaetidylinositol phosphate synthase
MLTNLRERIRPLTHRVGKALGDMGVTPNSLTLTGLVLSLLTPVAIYAGYFWLGISLFVISSVLDVLDGAVAKATGKSSLRGSFLDSFSDRIADASFTTSLLFIGINPELVIYILTSSYLISYSRAKGESLGLKVEGVGIMERGERVILLGVTLIAGGLGYTFLANLLSWIMAALNTVTVIHRASHILSRGPK